MELTCKHEREFYNTEDIAWYISGHRVNLCKILNVLSERYEKDLVTRLYEHALPFSNAKPGNTEYFIPDNELLLEVVKCLHKHGCGYLANNLYSRRSKYGDEIKEHQRSIVEHMRECCGCGDFLDALSRDESGDSCDFLDFISKKRYYWILTGLLLPILKQGFVRTPMYDVLLRSVPFLRRAIDNELYLGDGYHDTINSAILFSGSVITPQEVTDFAICHSKYRLFQELICDEEFYIDILIRDIIPHLNKISEIHAGIAKQASAMVSNEALVTEIVSKYLESTPKISTHGGTTNTIRIYFETEYLSSGNGESEDPVHIVGRILPAFLMYTNTEEDPGWYDSLPMDHISNTTVENIFSADTISTKDLLPLLEVFEENSVPIFLNIEEVKLGKP